MLFQVKSRLPHPEQNKSWHKPTGKGTETLRLPCVPHPLARTVGGNHDLHARAETDHLAAESLKDKKWARYFVPNSYAKVETWTLEKAIVLGVVAVGGVETEHDLAELVVTAERAFRGLSRVLAVLTRRQGRKPGLCDFHFVLIMA